MLVRETSIAFLASWVDACALWRFYFPYMNLPSSQFHFFAQAPKFEVFAGCDIIAVQRCHTMGQFKFIETAKALELKVIYDLDDDVFDIPEYNPAYALLNRYREGFIACMQLVDVITVSTDSLAKIVRRQLSALMGGVPRNRAGKEVPVLVVENRIDTRMFAAPVRKEKLIVGWQGSSSHVGDLAMIADGIKELVEQHSDVVFQFRGCNPPESLTGLSNVHHRYWTPVAQYGLRMPLWGWSVALAPVVDHPFNNSKSAIKMIEAAYCGIPCLASWVAPYEYFCSKDKELQWLLCAGPSAWKKKLYELIHDKARREELGLRSHKVAMEHFSFNRPHEGWLNAIKVARAC